MRISVQFPLKTKSENVLRSLPFAVANAPAGKRMAIAHAIAGSVKKQRKHVRMILDSQLPRLRQVVGESILHQRTNFYRVTLIRISAGELDTDGLAGALKAVRDEVAAWLGVGDGPSDPASWRCAQQRGPRGVHAVRIEIEDDDPDQREVHRIVGPPIAKLGPVVGDGTDGRPQVHPGDVPHVRHGLSRPGTSTVAHGVDGHGRQEKLTFRRAFVVVPEEQDEASDEWTLRELTTLPRDAQDNPPMRIMMAGRPYQRRLDSTPALGEHWIYEAAPSAALPMNAGVHGAGARAGR